MDEKKQPDPGASSAGYHFYWSYLDCPRKFFFNNILGWEPMEKPWPLEKGRLLHLLADAYVKVGTKGEALKALQGEELTQEQMDDILPMFSAWVDTWSDFDKRTYDLVGSEVELSAPAGPRGDIFTGRIDRIVRMKTSGEYIAVDLKTTGWSVDKAYQGVELEDQATGYIWLLSKVHPEWNVRSFLVDIIYKKFSKVEAVRPGALYIGNYDLLQFELNLVGIIDDLSQRIAALKEHEPELLFPRNGRSCHLYGCTYQTICRNRTKVADGPNPPMNFRLKDDKPTYEE